ncbi:hypothetical protein AUP68_11395 [Ilyonectria robusta]
MLSVLTQKKYAYALLAGVTIVVLLTGNYAYNNRQARQLQTGTRLGTLEANLRYSEHLPTTADASGRTKARTFSLEDLAELE